MKKGVGLGALALAALAIYYFTRASRDEEVAVRIVVPETANVPDPVADWAPQAPSSAADEQQRAVSSSTLSAELPAATATVTPSQALIQVYDGSHVKPAEAEWLTRAGFPAFRDSASPISEQQLTADAARGSLVARVKLGSLLAQRPTQRERGLQLLHEAAADGSIFALHELRALNLMPARQATGQILPPQLAHAAAYQQVALALGDLSMASPFRDLGGRALPAELQVQANVLTAMMLSQLNQMSLQRRGVSLQPSLRPSFETSGKGH